MQLRLSQERVVTGPRPKDGQTPLTSTVGGRTRFDCTLCEQRDPGTEAITKQMLGCRKGGLTYLAPKPLRIDCTGVASKDFARFCPGSLRDTGTIEQMYRCIEIEQMGGFDKVYHAKLYHLPLRVLRFYRGVLQARNRFEDEVRLTRRHLFGED